MVQLLGRESRTRTCDCWVLITEVPGPSLSRTCPISSTVCLWRCWCRSWSITARRRRSCGLFGPCTETLVGSLRFKGSLLRTSPGSTPELCKVALSVHCCLCWWDRRGPLTHRPHFWHHCDGLHRRSNPVAVGLAGRRRGRDAHGPQPV